MHTDKAGKKGFMTLALSSQVSFGALKVSIVVGTLLVFINHGDKLISMSFVYADILKILLTYLVPYCVSTWSAVRAIQSQEK